VCALAAAAAGIGYAVAFVIVDSTLGSSGMRADARRMPRKR
jgi:hypothetical protein